MTSCFPDLNVWLALSVPGHSHSADAWRWLRNSPPEETTLIFCRHTQIGLLRLLTGHAAMGPSALKMKEAWSVYDQWLGDPRVEFHPEPRDLETIFRDMTASLAEERPPKAIGDCYLLAFARRAGATLVTFDKALLALAQKHRCPAVMPV